MSGTPKPNREKFAGWHGLGDDDIERMATGILLEMRVPPGMWDDARSDAYLGAVHASGLYRPERGVKFSTYANQAMRNAVKTRFVTECRRRDRLPILGQPEDAGPTPVVADPKAKRPDELAYHRERIARVKEAVAKLPREYGRYFRLIYGKGMGYREACKAIGRSKEFARVQVRRAHGFLRSELEAVA